MIVYDFLYIEMSIYSILGQNTALILGPASGKGVTPQTPPKSVRERTQRQTHGRRTLGF